MTDDKDYSLALFNLIAKCDRQYGWTQGDIAKELEVTQEHLSVLKRGKGCNRRCKLYWLALVGLIAVRERGNTRSAQ